LRRHNKRLALPQVKAGTEGHWCRYLSVWLSTGSG
jgi:hypothetical protein